MATSHAREPASMMTLPRITTTLKAADDWASWLQQVRACVSALDWKDYITPEAGFSPPAPPSPPPADGMRGSQKLLEWSYDRERVRYEASRAEYDGFVLSVKKSIDPTLGADISEGRGFKELFEDLKARLHIDILVEKPKLERVWRVLMAQSLGEIGMKEWGDKVVEAYHFLREVRSNIVIGWEPYLEFVDNINKYYPVVAPAVYFRLYDMQRRQEKFGRGEPSESVFEEFVQINVAMISRLAEGSKQGYNGATNKMMINSAFEQPLWTGQGSEKRDVASGAMRRACDESQRQGTMHKSLENMVKSEKDTGARTVNSNVDMGNSGKSCDALNTTIGKTPLGLNDILIPETLKSGVQRQEQQEVPPMVFRQIPDKRKQGCARPETTLVGCEAQDASLVASKGEIVSEQKQQGMLQKIPTLLTGERNQGNRAVENMKLGHQDHKEASSVTFKQASTSPQKQQGVLLTASTEISDGHKKGNSTPADMMLGNQDHRPQKAPLMASKQESTSEHKQQSTLRPAPSQILGGHKQGDAASINLTPESQEQKSQNVPSTMSMKETTSRNKLQSARLGTPEPKGREEAGTSEKPTPTTLDKRQKRDSPSAALKRKSEEEQEKQPGAPKVSRTSTEHRGRSSSRDEKFTCYICFNFDHVTSACWLLQRYRKYGEDAPRLGRAVMERCRAWLSDGEAGVEGLSGPTRCYCRVCLRPGHSTETCRYLLAYMRFGERTRGISEDAKARIEGVLRDEGEEEGREWPAP